MLITIIFTTFLLYISVLNCAGSNVQADDTPGTLTARHLDCSCQTKESCSQFLQLQLILMREQLSRQNVLLNELIGKLNDVRSLERNYDQYRSEQIRQENLLNVLVGKVSEFNEKFNKMTSLERNIDLYKSEQMQQGNLLQELMGKLNEVKTEQVSQKGLINKSADAESNQLSSSCADVVASRRGSGGIHQILVPGYSQQPFNVSCDQETQGGGWTTVLRRKDGSVDFYLNWDKYKEGFGSLTGEFFIGLDKLHFMTRDGQELLITMEDAKGQQRFARYDQFVIGNEEEAYKMIALGKYSGDAGDSLRRQAGQKFSARDRDNDQHHGHCAQMYTGAGWHQSCHDSNLMGRYNDNTHGKGINWSAFTSCTASLKSVQMMIRPRRYCN